MMSLIHLISGVVIGICLYAGTHFLLTVVRVNKGRLASNIYLLFSAMCFLAIAVLGCEISAYQTNDVHYFVEAFRWRSFFAFLFVILWAWFVFYYTKTGPRYIPSAISVGMGIFVIANFIAPHGQMFDEIPELKSLSFPWGETITFY